MRYIPGFKFIIKGTNTDPNVIARGMGRNIFNNNQKTFVNSPIDGLKLNTLYELSYIKPIYENGNVTKIKYIFTYTVPGVARYRIDVDFNSIKEAEDLFDLITDTKLDESKINESNINLRDRLINRKLPNIRNINRRN